jgi:hypothetical protein
MEITQAWNLRCGRDEAVQDDGDWGLKPETFPIVSQLPGKKQSPYPETACLSSVLGGATVMAVHQ